MLILHVSCLWGACEPLHQIRWITIDAGAIESCDPRLIYISFYLDVEDLRWKLIKNVKHPGPSPWPLSLCQKTGLRLHPFYCLAGLAVMTSTVRKKSPGWGTIRGSQSALDMIWSQIPSCNLAVRLTALRPVRAWKSTVCISFWPAASSVTQISHHRRSPAIRRAPLSIVFAAL